MDCIPPPNTTRIVIGDDLSTGPLISTHRQRYCEATNNDRILHKNSPPIKVFASQSTKAPDNDLNYGPGFVQRLRQKFSQLSDETAKNVDVSPHIRRKRFPSVGDILNSNNRVVLNASPPSSPLPPASLPPAVIHSSTICRSSITAHNQYKKQVIRNSWTDSKENEKDFRLGSLPSAYNSCVAKAQASTANATQKFIISNIRKQTSAEQIISDYNECATFKPSAIFSNVSQSTTQTKVCAAKVILPPKSIGCTSPFSALREKFERISRADVKGVNIRSQNKCGRSRSAHCDFFGETDPNIKIYPKYSNRAADSVKAVEPTTSPPADPQPKADSTFIKASLAYVIADEFSEEKPAPFSSSTLIKHRTEDNSPPPDEPLPTLSATLSFKPESPFKTYKSETLKPHKEVSQREIETLQPKLPSKQISGFMKMASNDGMTELQQFLTKFSAVRNERNCQISPPPRQILPPKFPEYRAVLKKSTPTVCESSAEESIVEKSDFLRQNLITQQFCTNSVSEIWTKNDHHSMHKKCEMPNEAKLPENSLPLELEASSSELLNADKTNTSIYAAKSSFKPWSISEKNKILITIPHSADISVMSKENLDNSSNAVEPDLKTYSRKSFSSMYLERLRHSDISTNSTDNKKIFNLSPLNELPFMELDLVVKPAVTNVHIVETENQKLSSESATEAKIPFTDSSDNEECKFDKAHVKEDNFLIDNGGNFIVDTEGRISPSAFNNNNNNNVNNKINNINNVNNNNVNNVNNDDNDNDNINNNSVNNNDNDDNNNSVNNINNINNNNNNNNNNINNNVNNNDDKIKNNNDKSNTVEEALEYNISELKDELDSSLSNLPSKVAKMSDENALLILQMPNESHSESIDSVFCGEQGKDNCSKSEKLNSPVQHNSEINLIDFNDTNMENTEKILTLHPSNSVGNSENEHTTTKNSENYSNWKNDESELQNSDNIWSSNESTTDEDDIEMRDWQAKDPFSDILLSARSAEHTQTNIFEDINFEDSTVFTSNAKLLTSSKHSILAGDGNPVRHSLINLVMEEDIPELLEAMAEEHNFVFEDYSASMTASTSGIIHLFDDGESKNRRKLKNANVKISFLEEPPQVFTYLDEESAAAADVDHGWNVTKTISFEEYQDTIQKAQDDAALQHIELARWRQKVQNSDAIVSSIAESVNKMTVVSDSKDAVSPCETDFSETNNSNNAIYQQQNSLLSA